MRHNRRGEPVGRESGVYLYGASWPEVCRKVDPVGVTSAAVHDQASTPLEFGPNLGTPSPQATGDRSAREHRKPLFSSRNRNLTVNGAQNEPRSRANRKHLPAFPIIQEKLSWRRD